MITPYERIMITVRFSCGCEGIVSEFRTPGTEQSRYRKDDTLCKNCQPEEGRANRLPEIPESHTIHYLVDGHKMLIEKDKEGYWRGRRYEHRQTIKKYFGKVDPRPGLEEASA